MTHDLPLNRTYSEKCGKWPWTTVGGATGAAHRSSRHEVHKAGCRLETLDHFGLLRGRIVQQAHIGNENVELVAPRGMRQDGGQMTQGSTRGKVVINGDPQPGPRWKRPTCRILGRIDTVRETRRPAALTTATVVFVLYRTQSIDLGWIPGETPVILVHNDDTVTAGSDSHPQTVHLWPEQNLGFGRGVNLALARVRTSRLIVCNPDTSLSAEHFGALVTADQEEVVVIPLMDRWGRPTSVVNMYPTSVAVALGALAPGRILPRGSLTRSLMAGTLGRWGRAHEQLLWAAAGSWPLQTHWFSGAVFSIDTERLRLVRGFDERYFLYMEDVDLADRLRLRFPSMAIRMAGTPPGTHTVGGSAFGHRRKERAAHLRSQQIYALDRSGLRWSLAAAMVRVLQRVEGLSVG